MKKRVTFDFETRSDVDLKKCGAYKYSLGALTQPTCLAFKVHGNPVIYFLDFKLVNTPWAKLSAKLKTLWSCMILEGYEFSAHNAFFEKCIYENILVKRYGWPHISPTQYRCTAAKAAACALPRGLEGAGETLGLNVQKDKRGYAAMMKTCRPTRRFGDFAKMVEAIEARLREGKPLTSRMKNWQEDKSKFEKIKQFISYEDDPETWETLYTYCKIDVKAEEALDDALPDLIRDEQEIWHFNQKLNWRGLNIDIPTVTKIVGIMDIESKLKLKELDILTMGLVTKPGARKSILDFLALEGIELPDIKAKTVEDVLAGDGLPEDVKRLLQIRQALSKTSTKKYQAFLNRANDDGRVRDILLYHGASTGRDTGTGIQPHNFPRGVIKVTKERPYAAVENIIDCDAEELRLLYGDSLSVLFSSVLRNMIMPSSGKELFVADFSKIEVAVLWWLADNKPGLAVLNAGLDPYKYQAAANTGKAYEDISDEGEERQLGKAQILGAGFRMGWKRFKETAHDMYRLSLTNRQSFDAIKSYREANKAVVDLWDYYEDAAIFATENQDKIAEAGKCQFKFDGRFLWVKLPSGRSLAYLKPEIVYRVFTFEVLETDAKGNEIIVERTSSPKKTLQHLGLDMSKKSMRTEFKHGGILTENIVQAVARDLMMPAMVRLERSGYQALLSVHDEGLCEKEIGQGSLEEFTRLLCQRPKWADNSLPIEAKGWCGPRYRK